MVGGQVPGGRVVQSPIDIGATPPLIHTANRGTCDHISTKIIQVKGFSSTETNKKDTYLSTLSALDTAKPQAPACLLLLSTP